MNQFTYLDQISCFSITDNKIELDKINKEFKYVKIKTYSTYIDLLKEDETTYDQQLHHFINTHAILSSQTFASLVIEFASVFNSSENPVFYCDYAQVIDLQTKAIDLIESMIEHSNHHLVKVTFISNPKRTTALKNTLIYLAQQLGPEEKYCFPVLYTDKPIRQDSIFKKAVKFYPLPDKQVIVKRLQIEIDEYDKNILTFISCLMDTYNEKRAVRLKLKTNTEPKESSISQETEKLAKENELSDPPCSLAQSDYERHTFSERAAASGVYINPNSPEALQAIVNIKTQRHNRDSKYNLITFEDIEQIKQQIEYLTLTKQLFLLINEIEQIKQLID